MWLQQKNKKSENRQRILINPILSEEIYSSDQRQNKHSNPQIILPVRFLLFETDIYIFCFVLRAKITQIVLISVFFICIFNCIFW